MENKQDTPQENATGPTSTASPKALGATQTMCNARNAKGKSCNGFLKQVGSGGQSSADYLNGVDVLCKCQSCGTEYLGPPFGHVRDPDKQRRYVEKELGELLLAAGGTLPEIVKNERGVFVIEEQADSEQVDSAPDVAPD